MQVVTSREAREYLRLGEQVFNKRVRDGVVPSIQLSQKRRIFTRESLDTWLENATGGKNEMSVVE
jgi:hypothetical protein